jgi:hypothetical protein
MFLEFDGTYRYDVSLATNALGAQYGCEFAKKCPNLKMLLHVSTGTSVLIYVYPIVHTVLRSSEWSRITKYDENIYA